MSNIYIKNTSILRKKLCWMSAGVADTWQSKPSSQVCTWRGSTTPRTGDAAVTSPLTIWEEETLHTTKPFVARVLAATEKPSTPARRRRSRSNTPLTGQPDPAWHSLGETHKPGRAAALREREQMARELPVRQRGWETKCILIAQGLQFRFVPCTSLKRQIFLPFQGFFHTESSLVLPLLWQRLLEGQRGFSFHHNHRAT